MFETAFKKIKSKICNTTHFRYPQYSIINNIKITNLNIFSKIITKNIILIYGNYDVIIYYNNILTNNHITKSLIKYTKSSFRKILYYDISKFGPIENIKTQVELLSKPISIYSLRKFPYYVFRQCSLCETSLYLYISVNLYKTKLSSEFNGTNLDISENKSMKNQSLSNNISLDNKLSAENNTTNENSISLSTIEESSNYCELNKESSDIKKINKKTYDLNNINADIDNSTETPSILPDTNQCIKPYSIKLYSGKNIGKIPRKKLIEANVILGRGYGEVFLEKIIDLSDQIKPIWKISEIMTKASISKIDISGKKAFADGFAYIDINYKTYLSLDIDTVNGSIEYIHLTIPFSLCIDLVADCNYKIKDSDHCKVSSIYVYEAHNLNDPTTIDNETIYNEFTGQFIVQLTVLVTRTMELYI